MISCAIITNCQRNLTKTVNSVLFCDEIILLKDTVACRGRKVKAEVGVNDRLKVIDWNSEKKSFSDMRNYAMQRSKGDWILFIDDDEVVSNQLRKEIIFSTNNSSQKTCFYIKRRELVGSGREVKFGEVWEARKKGFIRLVSKNAGKWQGIIHEVFKPYTNVKISRLNSYILHHSHSSIAEFLSKVNFYSSLRAQELSSLGRRPNILETISLPFLKFFYTYIILLGFLDGYWGFVYSFMMSFHSFLVRAKSIKL